MKKLHTILMFAQNKRGVLERITMIIRRKMYNLEQITASDTEKEGIKRLTISFSHEEEAKIPQIIKQLGKIVEVIEVKDVTQGESVKREVALIKLEKPNNLSQLTSLAEIFRADIVDVSTNSVILQIVGDSHKIHDFRESLGDFKILEFGSSGGVAMERG